MELKWDEDGETLRMAQPSYISELMQRHEVVMAKPAPFYKPEVPENPVVAQDGIREAQGLVGELLWVSVRTRSDVAFEGFVDVATCHLPTFMGLVYGRCLGDRGAEGDLPFARSMRRLEMYASLLRRRERRATKKFWDSMASSNGNRVDSLFAPSARQRRSWWAISRP